MIIFKKYAGTIGYLYVNKMDHQPNINPVSIKHLGENRGKRSLTLLYLRNFNP
jgi:hypothetical protein